MATAVKVEGKNIILPDDESTPASQPISTRSVNISIPKPTKSDAQEVTEKAPSANKPPEENDVKETKQVMRLMMIFTFFFGCVKDGLGPLVSVFLVVSAGWTPGKAGVIWFVRDGATLVCNPFIGALIDRSNHKRFKLLIATGISAIAATSFAWTQSFPVLIVLSTVGGAAASLIQPAKSALILGFVDQTQFDREANNVEMADHAGSFVGAAFVGIVSYFLYPEVSVVFYIFGVNLLLACMSLVFMPLSGGKNCDNVHTDDNEESASTSSDDEETGPASPRKSSSNCFLQAKTKIQEKVRNVFDETQVDYEASRNMKQGEGPATFGSILKDKDILLYGLSVFSFHLGNSAILPLLSQFMASGSGRAGIPFACANIAIAQATSVFSSWFMHATIAEGRGYKLPVCVGYFTGVPLRCAVIVILIEFWPNTYALMATQLLDGIGAGTFGLSLPLFIKVLTHGTGHFSFTMGAVCSAWMTAAALSNLISGYIVTYTSYSVGFIFLGMAGSVSVALVSFVNVNPVEELQLGATTKEGDNELQLGATTNEGDDSQAASV